MKFIERFSRKSSQQPQPADAVQAPLLMALEPRIMFDASVGVVAQDAAADVASDTAKDSTSADKTAVSAASATSAASGSAQNSQRQEVVFVDGQVANVGELLQGLSGNAEVVILDPNKDGLQQMADYLKGREGLDAIHLLSHGADGSVQMGNLWLSNANLAEHRAELESIGAALKADGDLMLYGCRVGETERGQEFIDQLAQITGADVAASADDTGAADLGGNWTLERTSGAIETTALGAQLQGYEALMSVAFSGDLSASGPVLGSGQLSRMVIGDFNNDGRDDILYQIGGDGTNWRFAAGNANGTFTVVEQGQSPFSGVTLINAVTNGINYYAADFDKDGDIDLLGVESGGAAYLYRNNNGVFARETVTSFGGTQYNVRLVVGDFDGDGAADILYQPGNVDSGNSWRYAKNNGDGTFTDVAQSASPFAAFTLGSYSSFNYRVLDFDGDGDLDIMWVANGSKGTLYVNNGGSFTLGSTTNFPTTPYGGRTLWGDFDGDGDADVFYQNGTNGSEWMYGTNNGDGTFTTVARASSPFAGLSMVDFSNSNFRAGDFDGDGDLDVIGISATGSSYVYYQSGTTPRLVSATPADDSLNVSPAANIVLTFSESVTKGTGNIYIVRTSDGQVVQTIPVTSAQVTGSGTTFTIDPSDLAQGTAYAVRIDSKTFVNTDGKVYKGIYNNTALNFTTSVVQAPVISNLNGDSVSYTEDAAYVLIDQNSNAVVTDADSVNFAGGKMTVQITSGLASGEDVLFIRDQGNGANLIFVSGASVIYNGLVVGTFTGGTNGNPLVITFTNNANPTTVSALVQNLAYRNSNSTEPSTTARSVSIAMDDGAGGSSTTSVVSLSVVAVNDAPVVNITATNPTYTENTSAVQLFSGATINTVESGQSVLQMVFTVSGIANGSSEKLVIDGTDVTLVQGTSLTTSANGISVTVSVSSGTATVTLDKAAGLSTATAQTILNNIAYRNDSDTPITTNRVVTLSSVSDNGGTAGGGQPTAAVGIFSTVTVVGINDAPVLSGGPYNFVTINEDSTATGVQISAILASHTMTDADTGALRGVAIIAKTGNGTWQYSTDNSNWTDFGAVSSTSGLLIASATYVRYVPDAANGETATLTFRGWDQTTGTASANGIRSTADTTNNGGTTAFSIGTGAVNQIVTSVNDAPVMIGVAPTLGGLTDTSINNGGALVSDLLGGVTDVDTGALKGMAITGFTADYGKWQYSTNAGSTWSDIGSVSVTTALILTAQNMVRFVPDGIHGETATITYKAWDQTNATFGLQGTKTNTTTSGGTSAYSSQFDTATVVVTAVNERPVVTLTGTAAIWTEANNAPSNRIPVDSGVTVSDPDGPNPLSATVRLLTYYSSQDSLAFVNDGLSMGNIVGTWSAGTGILTLTSAGNLATAAEFQAAMRAVTYGNSSDTPNTTSRTIQFQITDGGNMASIAVTRDVTIVAVNDSPTISAPVSQSINEDIPTALGSITFSDVDSTLGIVTFSLVGGTGTLSATGAGGVTVGGTSTALTLSGTLANINLFIANNRLVYTPAANASGDVTLTINVNTTSVSDATTTMTLQVQAVNDAPVATVPPSITVTEDVSSVITGISFTDIDVGINAVTATFSVPSGTLSATTGLGVTVGGSGTGLLTLTGSLADINFFIAANGLTFKTAQDATASVILTVNINDGGFSGSGGEQTDTKTVTLNVTAVNDAPVNNVPGVQTASQNVALGFNTANGNAISISDVDAGNGLITVTLTAVNGTLTLSNLSGINMVSGTGLNNVVMIFEGNRTNLNAALQSLTFRPTNNFLGAASVTIETNDNGNSGTGGAKSDVDTISINVIPVNPKVTNVSAQGLDRTVKIGDEVLISMTWDQVVNVDLSSGRPTLLLETGLVDRSAEYVSGTGTNTLVFKYTVQAGDISADLDFQSTAALQLNGAVISNNTSDLAVLTLPTVGGSDSLGGRSNIVVDGVVPVVGSVSAPTNGTYITGQGLDFTVNFNEAMTVDTTTGVPRIAVTLDTGGTVYAEYVSGSGSSALVFRMVVASGQLDSNGITLGSSIDTNGGAITDLAGNATVTTLNSVASTAGVNVDGVAPSIVSVVPPVDGSYKAGDVLTFTVNASEALQIGSLAPRLVLDVGGVTRYATYVSGSGSGALVFQYVVQTGDNDANGIAVSSLDLRGEQLTDLAGNDIDPTLGSGNLPGVLVDTTRPLVQNINLRDPASINLLGSATFDVIFSETVSVVDPRFFVVAVNGNTTVSIDSITSLDGKTWTVKVSGITGQGHVGIIVSGSGVVDAAGNTTTGSFGPVIYHFDRVAPSITSVSVPTNGTYVAGQSLDFSVTLDEDVQLTSNGQSPSILVNLGNGQTALALLQSQTGNRTLTFRLTVEQGQLDTDGITLGSSINLNGATLRDAAGNDANLTLNNVGDTSGINVDAVAPVIDSVTLPPNGEYRIGEVLTFTVNTSENLVLDTSGGTPYLLLDVAGIPRYAMYVSGGADGKMVFEYSVQPGENATGLAITRLDLNGASARDAAGNAMVLDVNGVGDTSGIVIDNTAPTLVNFTQLTASPTASSSVVYSLLFSEKVSGVDQALTLSFTGTLQGAIESITSVDGKTWLVTVSGLTGQGNARLAIDTANGVKDVAGNPARGYSTASEYRVDRVDPTVASVSVPAAGTYVAGQNLDFTVTMDENIEMVVSANRPTIEVKLGNGQTALATYVSQTGSRTLLFRMTVAEGQIDSDGIALGSSINLNGAILRDSVRNNADTTLKNVGDTRQILVDAVVPNVTGVTLPAAGTYQVGSVLRFDVAVSENVNVVTSNGVPRLVLDIGGVTRFASYVSGTGTSMLTFEYTVVAGDNASGIGVASVVDVNGGTLRDAAGNDMTPQLNAPASNAGVIIDTAPPVPLSIVAEGAYQASDRSLSFTLTFNEAVSGVDTGDFSLLGTQSATGTVQSVQQIDARTYRIVVSNITGQGSLSLNLNAPGSGIQDAVGNLMTQSLASSAQGIPNQDVGDLEYRINPPDTSNAPQPSVIQPQVPGIIINESISPLAPGSLFEVRTVGGDLKPLGTIFLGQAGSAPSFIAQVFGSSDTGLGGGDGQGFLGFGGGNGGIFGGSTFATIFGREVPGVTEMNVFSGSQWKQSDLNQGLRGVFGVPTFGQQLQQINEADQRHVRELAKALAKPAEIGQRA